MESRGEAAYENSVMGIYRSLEPFLTKPANLYLRINDSIPCLHLFNEQKGWFCVAVGADGAPFGRDDTVTTY